MMFLFLLGHTAKL